MERKTLITRLRQLHAVDTNALDVYMSLAKLTGNADQRKSFLGIANDEKRHVALGREMLSLLEK